ncbi:MAG: aromatic ring-hydroxylating dioxygenase subunit alpha [Gammaproteobacteria bacterium]|nr:aromatic ring-hydroxylating dioxygenase subunit alpha [Gammaproteobacteria bacterium]MCP4088350.1 aromatic ring-hydroxylating dioxygenase subunit alpha [Gammaproteobacteria bacterium]MCP4275112.1 aromatic ring-hydroxylating dioxygenase subunit alpha [Gammaproteobacteria bacterium]MCP4830986.1 aromatic ring-hydroxylating dioxygenase subunit alpha [Gammaproteobacteria bacterium]MCP4927493.1 aromatic ring-hydroxylating dioxygenase subunit alpha [Gammaproteobacteria bacterium]
MYINFWYPIARSEEVVNDKPLQVNLLGLSFVAFRDASGKAGVLANTCVHRGGSLSKGIMKNGCIACPYHGWQFNAEGECTHIPSLINSKIPARAKADAYPVQERYGIVFAFLGDLPEEERPPLHDIKEYGTEGWKTQLYVFEVACNYERSVENGLDPIHNEFVHPAQGAPMLPPEQQSSPMPMEDIPWGSKFYLAFPSKKEVNTELNPKKTGKRIGAAGSWFQGPNQLVTWIDISEENSFHQYLFEAPIDDSHTRIFFVNMRSWLLEDEHDERIKKPTLDIVHEDVKILESLEPINTPLTNTKEVLVPGDTVVLRYREWLAEWDAKGWRIDFPRLQAEKKATAFAIPSPGRRESGNWVLDPVPLKEGGEQTRTRRTLPSTS